MNDSLKSRDTYKNFRIKTRLDSDNIFSRNKEKNHLQNWEEMKRSNLRSEN